ncbi:MAG TPA: thioesterase family protein [Candidatus Dormibacteraeota bacterium]|nr:thioesterase family protein [Candidatus Dormibacteraeota bacterium]
MRSIGVGQEGLLEQKVGPEHGADRLQNAGVTVLATPVLCHWFESAAVRAIAEQLEPGEASVGTRVGFEHLKATPVGMQVRVIARVAAVDGRRVDFEISAFDEVELVARGTHQRVVIDLERFLARVQGKRASALKGGPDVR